jgi:hypothetical protein
MKLAQENPAELEKLRQEKINQFISNANEAYQSRLRGLQFQIDAHRQIHTESPMGACMKISQMMHESFAALRSHLNDLTHVNDPLREFVNDHDLGSNKAADILAFPSS